MSKSKATRSSKVKDEPTETPKNATIAAIRKVFFVPEDVLRNAKKQIKLERFYHPGKSSTALFLTQEDIGNMLEVLEFAEPRRSWLINSDVCSNGRIYITTPIDSTFLALHALRKHCAEKAQALDSIHDEAEPSIHRLLTKFVQTENLRCIADVKRAGDMSFYKYNPKRTLAWLTCKTRKVVQALKVAKVHCGHSALSENYARSEKQAEEENAVSEMDYTRMACDIVGAYLDLELHEELKSHLEIPNEIQALVEEKSKAKKRKSQTDLNVSDGKKIKVATENGVAAKLKNSSLLDESIEEKKTSPVAERPTPLKERTLTTKEKQFAKVAKGTKSIASFFTKK